MPAKKIVYDLSGDEPKPLERFAIVADELVASDPKRYVYEVPKKSAAEAHVAHKGKK